MPKLPLLPRNRQIDVAAGATVLQALLSEGIDAPHQCGGQATCGSCHVFVHEGRRSLSRIQKIENGKLDAMVGIGSKSRLACQAVIGGEDISIEFPGFSSGL